MLDFLLQLSVSGFRFFILGLDLEVLGQKFIVLVVQRLDMGIEFNLKVRDLFFLGLDERILGLEVLGDSCIVVFQRLQLQLLVLDQKLELEDGWVWHLAGELSVVEGLGFGFGSLDTLLFEHLEDLLVFFFLVAQVLLEGRVRVEVLVATFLPGILEVGQGEMVHLLDQRHLIILFDVALGYVLQSRGIHVHPGTLVFYATTVQGVIWHSIAWRCGLLGSGSVSSIPHVARRLWCLSPDSLVSDGRDHDGVVKLQVFDENVGFLVFVEVPGQVELSVGSVFPENLIMLDLAVRTGRRTYIIFLNDILVLDVAGCAPGPDDDRILKLPSRIACTICC